MASSHAKLIAKARKAGLDVSERWDGTVIVTRKGRGAASIAIHPNRTILRNDVRFDLMTRISAAFAAAVLGL